MYEDLINNFDESNQKLNDLNDLYELAEEEKDLNTKNEILKNLLDLKKFVKKMKLNVFYQIRLIL